MANRDALRLIPWQLLVAVVVTVAIIRAPRAVPEQGSTLVAIGLQSSSACARECSDDNDCPGTRACERSQNGLCTACRGWVCLEGCCRPPPEPQTCFLCPCPSGTGSTVSSLAGSGALASASSVSSGVASISSVAASTAPSSSVQSSLFAQCPRGIRQCSEKILCPAVACHPRLDGTCVECTIPCDGGCCTGQYDCKLCDCPSRPGAASSVQASSVSEALPQAPNVSSTTITSSMSSSYPWSTPTQPIPIVPVTTGPSAVFSKEMASSVPPPGERTRTRRSPQSSATAASKPATQQTKCSRCAQCGDGLLNICDQTECLAPSCVFTDGWVIDSCAPNPKLCGGAAQGGAKSGPKKAATTKSRQKRNQK